jgi:4-hydroxy-tetrahydrodipicolinate reductase
VSALRASGESASGESEGHDGASGTRVTRVALHGAGGRMGRAVVAALAETPGLELVAAFGAASDSARGRDVGELAGIGALGVPLGVLDDAALRAPTPPADVVIDFSSPEGVVRLAARCAEAGVALVSGTTGLSSSHEEAFERLATRAPVVHAPNMSVGVAVLFHLAEVATRLLGPAFDAEIVELHHRLKIDAPSGTAVRLAERVAHARGLEPSSAVVHGRSGQVGPRPNAEIGVMTLRGGSVVGEHTLVLAGPSERVELVHRAQDRSIFAHGALRAARWVLGRPPARYGMDDVLGLRG